jgi:hypothetical protein
MRTRNAKRGSTPAGSARNRLALKARERGKSGYNLWYQYGPKAGKDWVLSSDLEFLHFISLEADPDVLRYDLALEPMIVAVGDDNHRFTFDALVEFRNGKRKYREVKFAQELRDQQAVRTQQQVDAEATWSGKFNEDFEIVTDETLAPLAMRLHNWIQIIPAIARVRHLPMEATSCAAKAAIASLQTSTIGEIAAGISRDEIARWYAAIFMLIQEGQVTSNLDSAPLSKNTLIHFVGA